MKYTKEFYKTAAATVIKNLGKRNMEGYYCESSREAVELILSMIPEGSSIANGGSMTIFECGLMDAVKSGNYKYIDRSSGDIEETDAKIFSSDYFLMSTNAITYDGQLVNIDGRANRVSFLCYGPKNVIIVAGMNKLSSDVESALKRVRDVASPKNTLRLGKKTPCSVTGKCGDCLSEDCICCQTVITRMSRVKGRIKVILVGEKLGY